MDRPALVRELEGVFGASSSAAFGSSVFFESQSSSGYPLSLVDASIEKYQAFCGETWARFGEEKWLSGWKELYHRSPGDTAGIVNEFRSIKVQPFRSSEGVRELRIFSLGDGEAMSGFLIAGDIVDLGRLFLAFLMD